MKVSRIIITIVLILSVSAAFCLTCTGIKNAAFDMTKAEDYESEAEVSLTRENREEDDDDEETSEKKERRTTNKSEEETTKKTNKITEKETKKTTERTTQKATEKETEKTTKKKETTTRTTTQKSEEHTVYDAAEIKQNLINETWCLTLPDCSVVECVFYSNCTYSLYDDEGNFIQSGYYSLDGVGICLTDSCGNTIMYLKYNPETESFGDVPSTQEETTVQYTDLNSSNVKSKLRDAFKCYDECVNCTTFGFRTSYSDGIICPHCVESGMADTEGAGYAWLVTNFSSRTEVERYISTYLYGNAREDALFYLDSLFKAGTLIESDGRLYLCPMYNDRGYTPLDTDTIRYIGTTDKGIHTVEINDGEYWYRFTVVNVDGTYKISDLIY